MNEQTHVMVGSEPWCSVNKRAFAVCHRFVVNHGDLKRSLMVHGIL